MLRIGVVAISAVVVPRVLDHRCKKAFSFKLKSLLELNIYGMADLACPIIVAVGAIVAIVSVIIKIGKWIQKINAKLEGVGKSTGLLLFIHRKELFKLYDKFYPPHSSNPTPTEKEILLAKLREGTITSVEAERLRPMLEKQRADASAKDLIGAAIIIGGLLLLLAMLSALAGRE